MDRQNIRLFFLFALVFIGMFLFSKWQQEHAMVVPISNTNKTDVAKVAKEDNANKQSDDLPEIAANKKEQNLDHGAWSSKSPKERLIDIETDVMKMQVDLLGGDLVYLELLKYPQNKNADTGFILFDQSSERSYIAQSGLLSKAGPDSQVAGRGLYQSRAKSFQLKEGRDKLEVYLTYNTQTGVQVTKNYTFKRGSYLVEQKYKILNQGKETYEAHLFGRLKRNPQHQESTGFFGAMRTYTGIAVNTPETKYKKISFDDVNKKIFRETITGGWGAMVEHYFTSAWIPAENEQHQYQSEKFSNDMYGIRFINNKQVIVPPGEKAEVGAKLYAGPEVTDVLKQISPGLDLTVDYGPLWWLCQPIFALLKYIHNFVNNWGVAIILTTLVIKLLFYKLSAMGYRSMGNMRKLQPKMQALKERYGDDKNQFGKAMMELYRKEKINPLGGCFPIIIQIPVFIALYYVLLESVELRHAPFALWLNDLSAKDPYYVLPIIMGGSMFLQQKMNPAPPDPVQAKVMMFMPVMFTFLFFSFPSGLVLYWVVNNFLSILQQWMITRSIDKKTTKKIIPKAVKAGGGVGG